MEINNWLFNKSLLDFGTPPVTLQEFLSLVPENQYCINVASDNCVYFNYKKIDFLYAAEKLVQIKIADNRSFYLNINGKNKNLSRLKFSDISSIFYKIDLSWTFYQEYTFESQMAIKTETNWIFLFEFGNNFKGKLMGVYKPLCCS